MSYEHFHGKEIELPVFWGMAAMAVFCLTWFYCCLTGSTKVYRGWLFFGALVLLLLFLISVVTS